MRSANPIIFFLSIITLPVDALGTLVKRWRKHDRDAVLLGHVLKFAEKGVVHKGGRGGSQARVVDEDLAQQVDALGRCDRESLGKVAG